MAPEAAALFLRRISCAHADLRFMDRDALLSSHVGDPRQRRAQVAFHVNSKGLQRADVDDAAALRLITTPKHEPVETPEESRQCLASPCRSKYQSAFTLGNRRPAETLR